MDRMIERWLPVVGHERYEVSDQGRVRGPRGLCNLCAHDGSDPNQPRSEEMTTKKTPAKKTAAKKAKTYKITVTNPEIEEATTVVWMEGMTEQDAEASAASASDANPTLKFEVVEE